MMTEPGLPEKCYQPVISGDLGVEAMLGEARLRAGLEHYGSEWFRKPLGVLAAALENEAGLSPQGRIGYREHIIRSLINRLRMMEQIRLHPEILSETLEVACVIVGLPRTGSTMFQRMLTAMPEMTGVLWWELQNFAPFPAEVHGEPLERRAEAQQIMQDWLAATPELASIHPMSVDQADEESVLLDHVFSGTAPEMFAWVPSFFEFQANWDQREAYADLALMLRFLQWQAPGRAGRKWILKAPTHLTAPEAVLETFPDALIVTTHRDPKDVIPSVCSMTYTLYKLFAAEPDPLAIGSFFPDRWAKAFAHFDRIRSASTGERFMDVNYLEVLKDPIGQAKRVYKRLGLEITPEAEAAVTDWLAENGRSERPSHNYDLATFGLSADGLDVQFAAYRQKYLNRDFLETGCD